MMQYDDNAEKYGYEGEMTTLKCDELKRYEVRADYDAGTIDVHCDNEKYGNYMLAEDVIAAIAELKEAWRSEHEACEALKQKLDEKDNDIAYWREEYDKETQLTDALKDEIESLKASHYAEMVDAGMRERRLRRALYKACANWAHIAVAFFSSYVTKNRWRWMELKSLKKVEEYK